MISDAPGRRSATLRPSALAVDDAVLRAGLERCAAALEATIRETLPCAVQIETRVRPSLPYPHCRVRWSAPKPLSRALLQRLERRWKRQASSPKAPLFVAIPSTHSSPPSPGDERSGQVHELEAIAWGSERLLRLDLAVHDRAREHSPWRVGRDLGWFDGDASAAAPDEASWLSAGATALRVVERIVGSAYERAGFQVLRDGFDELRRQLEHHPPTRSDLPLRCVYRQSFENGEERRERPLCDAAWPDPSQPSRGAAELGHVYVTAEQADGEIERLGEVVRRLYAELGLRAAHAPFCSGERGGVWLVENRWGLFEHWAGAIRQIPESDDDPRLLTASSSPSERLSSIGLSLTPSNEALLARLVERYGRDVPAWLAPVQVKVVPICEQALPRALEVEAALREAGLRTALDRRRESWENKVRVADDERVPWFLVLGNREVESGEVDLRQRGAHQRAQTLPLARAIEAAREGSRLPLG